MRDARGNGMQQVCASGTLQTGLPLMRLFTALCIVIAAVIIGPFLPQALRDQISSTKKYLGESF